jgi:fatty acid desaturase
MVRADVAPAPVVLMHLRPADAAGVRIVALAIAGTTAGVVLSFSGGWAAWLAGQALLALMLVHWFVILHECGHETLFRTRRYHAAVGFAAAAFSMIPYHCWIRVHGRHHKWTGWQDLDPTTASLVPRPLGRAERAIVNACWRFWVPLFSIIYRAANYWHLPRVLAMFPGPADRRAVLRDAGVLAVLYALVIWAVGPAEVLRGAGVAVVLSLVLEDLLLLSQHTHVPQHVSHGVPVRPFPAVEQESFTRSLRFPRLVSAFVLNFDAHELHHMYPFVPGYHLRRIPYRTENEIGWWRWISGAKRLSGEVLLFQNRRDTGWDI